MQMASNNWVLDLPTPVVDMTHGVMKHDQALDCAQIVLQEYVTQYSHTRVSNPDECFMALYQF